MAAEAPGRHKPAWRYSPRVGAAAGGGQAGRAGKNPRGGATHEVRLARARGEPHSCGWCLKPSDAWRLNRGPGGDRPMAVHGQLLRE